MFTVTAANVHSELSASGRARAESGSPAAAPGRQISSHHDGPYSVTSYASSLNREQLILTVGPNLN
jgi:hypothetical protein